MAVSKRAVVFLVAASAALVASAASRNEDCILFDASYGRTLPGSSGDVGLWWASSMWKVAKSRPVPKKGSKAIEICAARNEADAAQLVVFPSRQLTNLMAAPTELAGPDGEVIPAQQVDVLRVRYVDIQRPTDRTSVAAPWPDPLPPFKEPITLRAGENQPLWIRVMVPPDARAGLYKGAIRLAADGYAADVPLHVVVYDFELPDRMTCQTAFGFDAGAVWGYQRITDPVQRREVLEKYWEVLAAHHISPYDPAPMDPVTVEWVKLGEEEAGNLPAEDRALLQENALTPKFSWEPWTTEVRRVFDKHHFNSFRISMPGIAGELQGFQPDTRGHELAFTAHCQAMQEHYRANGLLGQEYIYWVDEPRKEDYAYVRDGFLRIKKAAPDLTRMITEHVVDGLAGGPNLWCPNSWWYEHDRANERRLEGDRFWWYVCTVPKAPFPGLFIDHPGTDMRVWLWQTWKYDIEGVLVWASNLWTTGNAYPDVPQNPYEDPMSWVSGAPAKKGEKLPWGNGDGRFVYPPEAAASGQQAETILDGPVESIRLETLRDGIEDYEYFVILKRFLAEKGDSLSQRQRKRFEALLSVPDEITADLRTYTKDPALIEARRDRIARAIEELAR